MEVTPEALALTSATTFAIGSVGPVQGAPLPPRVTSGGQQPAATMIAKSIGASRARFSGRNASTTTNDVRARRFRPLKRTLRPRQSCAVDTTGLHFLIQDLTHLPADVADLLFGELWVEQLERFVAPLEAHGPN